MSDKKHIDRIFQEKLKDFEVTPSPKVWKQIQSKIEQPNKETKKAYPIWMRLAGVAALLLLLLTIGNAIVNNQDANPKTNVVGTENPINASDAEKDNQNLNTNKLVDENTNALEKDATVNPSEGNLENKKTLNNLNEGSNNGVATSNPSETNTKDINEKLHSSNEGSTNSTNGIAESNSSKETSTLNKNKSVSERLTNNTTNKNRVTTNNESPNVVVKKDAPLYSDTERLAANTSNPQLEKGTANANNSGLGNGNKSNSEDIKTSSVNEGVVQNNSENRNVESLPQLDKEKADNAIKNSKNNALADNLNNTEEEKEENKTTEEETKEETPSIEEEIALAENIIEEEEAKKVNRWQVYASIAPVYYNTLGKGSHLDEQFNENTKSGEINTSYGVNVSYAFNEKLKLRTGINSLKLSYDTDNVILYENVGNSPTPQLKNIDLSNGNHGFSAISGDNLEAQQINTVFGENANAAISQRIGYYEVPLELEYTVVNKKFGVNVI